MNQKRLLKAANSKSQLAKAVIMYQKALHYYANENHWAVRTVYDSKGVEVPDVIIWVGEDDDPTLPAQTVLGMRKPTLKPVREPDDLISASTTAKMKMEASNG